MIDSSASLLTAYIADDHPIVVDGLKEILKSTEKIVVKGVAFDGEQLRELIKVERVDVVILDMHMPKLGGLECTRWIKENFPNTKVILLTMYPEKVFMEQLIKAGADGCLLKSRGSKDLIDAIDRVMKGRAFFDWIAEFNSRNASHHKSYKLSSRELEIIQLMARGKTSFEIAEILFLSEETVKTHRKNIFRKLDVHHVAELTSFAINNGLIKIEQ